MKKLVFTVAAGVFCLHAATAQQVKINGEAQFPQKPNKVLLMFQGGDDMVTDSADIQEGKFTFTKEVKEPTMASLVFRFPAPTEGARPKYQRMQFFIEPGTISINIKDTVSNAVVKGSESQTSYEALNSSLKPYEAKEREMGEEFRKLQEAKDEAGMEALMKDYESMNTERKEKVLKGFLQKNPNSPIALYVLNQYVGYDIEPAEVEPLYNSLSAANKNTAAGKSFKERLDIAKKTAVGAMAMDFTQNDTLGKPVSLSDFRGKYVLVDFWASWCGPCRAENPNVVEAFNKYNDKGFTVLGVSLDQPGKKDAWMAAIHKDNLTWTQVSDLKFWDNEVAKQYGIRAIPQNILVDPQGKIVAKNVRGEDLQTTLADIFK